MYVNECMCAENREWTDENEIYLKKRKKKQQQNRWTLYFSPDNYDLLYEMFFPVACESMCVCVE